jgi:hypothetical protein
MPAKRGSMKGILITAGENLLHDHERTSSFFVKCKGQRETYRESREGICISAFSRDGVADEEHASADGMDIKVLGMLIYRGFHGADALIKFREDLKKESLKKIIHDCDGQFCLVLRLSQGKGLKIVTDHAGMINMYKYQKGKTLAICSSSMALSMNYPVTVNKRAICQFLRSANVYGSETIYHEICLLEPATLYSFESSPEGISESKEKYWRPPVEAQEKVSFEEAKNNLLNTMLESFQALPREGIICDLTAGYDTRLNLALLSAYRPLKDIDVFVFGPPDSKEVGMVGDYCRALGMMAHHLELPQDWGGMIMSYVQRSLYATDGEENIFVYAPILWAQEGKAQTHAFSINGLGGELYRDFWWIQELYPSKRPANLDRLITTRVLQYEYDYSIFSHAWRSDMSDTRGIIKEEFLASIQDMDLRGTYNSLQIDNLYFRQKMRRWAGRTISSSNQIIGMLTPLAMKRCVSSVLSISPQYKRNGRVVKSIINELSPLLAGMKMLNGAPCQNMTFKNAHKFIPLAVDYGKRGSRKLVQKLLNRTILVDKSNTYQQSAFFAELFQQPAFREDFRYDALKTKRLYHPGKYAAFYKDATEGRSIYYQQLGNILTLEMRMRNDNIPNEII